MTLEEVEKKVACLLSPEVLNCWVILGNSFSTVGISLVSLSNNRNAACIAMRSLGSFVILEKKKIFKLRIFEILCLFFSLSTTNGLELRKNLRGKIIFTYHKQNKRESRRNFRVVVIFMRKVSI